VSNSFTRTSLSSWIDDDSVVDVFPMRDAPFPTTTPWLFFRKEQLAVQTRDLIYSFILTSKESGTILALLHCLPTSDGWVSPALAPFGGIMPAAPCHVGQMAFLLACVRDWVIFQGGSKLTIKTAPSCYAPRTHEICHRAYLAAGFSPNHTYSNHYIPIADRGFHQIIEPAERRRLSKGKKSGLVVTMQQGIFDGATEDFLRECYEMQGYPLPCSSAQLAGWTHVFPKNYLFFTNRSEGETVAVAVMVRVSDDILYHFMSGYLRRHRVLSPALMLFEAAFDYCLSENIGLLDLGISIDHLGNPKPSLSRFKQRIGGRVCEKIIYEARF